MRNWILIVALALGGSAELCAGVVSKTQPMPPSWLPLVTVNARRIPVRSEWVRGSVEGVDLAYCSITSPFTYGVSDFSVDGGFGRLESRTVGSELTVVPAASFFGVMIGNHNAVPIELAVSATSLTGSVVSSAAIGPGGKVYLLFTATDGDAITQVTVSAQKDFHYGLIGLIKNHNPRAVFEPCDASRAATRTAGRIPSYLHLRSGWRMDVKEDPITGITLERIQCGDRYFAARMGHTFVELTVRDLRGEVRTNVIRLGGRHGAVLTDFRVLENMEEPAGFPSDEIHAEYRMPHICAGKIAIQMRYRFTAADTSVSPGGYLNAARFIPEVYVMMEAVQNEAVVTNVRIVTECAFEPDGGPTSSGLFARDTMADLILPPWIHGVPFAVVSGKNGRLSAGSVMENLNHRFERSVDVAVAGLPSGINDATVADHFHQSWGDSVESSLSKDNNLAGCPECVHVHYRSVTEKDVSPPPKPGDQSVRFHLASSRPPSGASITGELPIDGEAVPGHPIFVYESNTPVTARKQNIRHFYHGGFFAPQLKANLSRWGETPLDITRLFQVTSSNKSSAGIIQVMSLKNRSKSTIRKARMVKAMTVPLRTHQEALAYTQKHLGNVVSVRDFRVPGPAAGGATWLAVINLRDEMFPGSSEEVLLAGTDFSKAKGWSIQILPEANEALSSSRKAEPMCGRL